MRDKLIRILARKNCSSWELAHKHPDIPSNLIQEFAQKGYIDDQGWLKTFCQNEEAKGSSPLAIAFKLRQKGIPREVIEVALQDLSPENALKKAIAKNSKKDKQKLIASLQRKGFSWELIKREVL